MKDYTAMAIKNGEVEMFEFNPVNGRGYCVVRAGSTSGKWKAKRTTRNQIQQSQAHICAVYPNREDAERLADKLNAIEK